MKSLESLSLSKDQIKTDLSSLQHYGKDWTTYFDIKASAILFPKTTDEVVQIVKWARAHKISLVPSGGRTGLSGAACALHGEVIVSFEKMNQIKNYNPIDQTVVCEAGVITEALQKFATEKGLYYPVDFAARGSSQIGGNIATNAGGIKVVRYGMTREWVAHLEIVTGTGEIIQAGHSLIKNATGYDFKHLFIGSEGTLGFITQATLRLTTPPKDTQVLFVGSGDLPSLMNVFSEFRKKTSLLAFEMLSDKALNYVLKSTGLPPPLEARNPYYAVIEVEKISPDSEQIIFETFENCMNSSWIADGTLSQSDEQAKTLWRYREDISESLSAHSPYKNDISVPIFNVPHFVKDLDKVLQAAYPDWEVIWFGHIGDGNLHINILRPASMTKEAFVKACRQVDDTVFKTVQAHQGSISAEHGVGLTKKSFLHYTRSRVEIDIMKKIKLAFDPDLIMNPGKIID